MDDYARITEELDQYVHLGLIKSWEYDQTASWGRGGTERPFQLIITRSSGAALTVKGLDRARIFTAGVDTALYAYSEAGMQSPSASPDFK